MEVSTAGINIIKSWEKYRSKPYLDAVGRWTNGYGHTAGVNEDTDPITVSDAILLLKQDLSGVEHYINTNFPTLRQCQFDALASLLYNVGTKDFLKTRLSVKLKTNPDDKHVADEWIEFRNAGGVYYRGLLRRRLDELRLYYSW